MSEMAAALGHVTIGVFVLEDACDGAGFDAAVACDGGAGAGSDVVAVVVEELVVGVEVMLGGRWRGSVAGGLCACRADECRAGERCDGEERRQKTAQIKSHGEFPYDGAGVKSSLCL
jgi:hypothetical protein